MNSFIISLLMRPDSAEPWPWYLPVSTPLEKGRPGGHAKVQRLCHRNQLPFNRPLQQTVFNLEANERRPAAKRSQRIGLSDPPSRRIGDADIEHLSLANQII